jgi:geranylgeranyl diphosphate synthase, type I
VSGRLNSQEARTYKALKRERVGWVFSFLDELIDELSVPASHKELLQEPLNLVREYAKTSPEMSTVQMPLLVHAAIAGDEKPAIPVAAACTILCLGVDLLDSVIDHELPPPWHVRDSAEINLTVNTLVGALPQLSIARLREGTPPARLWALARLLADTILTINAGQHEDLLFSNSGSVSLKDSRLMAERKTGSATAMLARAGAILATEDPVRMQAYAAFGSYYGIAKQLINDAWGIWGEGASQDLFNGRRTLPVVHALSALRGERREQLQRLLALSRESAEHHDEVRSLLATAGSARYAALIVWLYQQRARKHLAAASPQGSAGRELRVLLDGASLLPRLKQTQP